MEPRYNEPSLYWTHVLMESRYNGLLIRSPEVHYTETCLYIKTVLPAKYDNRNNSPNISFNDLLLQ